MDIRHAAGLPFIDKGGELLSVAYECDQKVGFAFSRRDWSADPLDRRRHARRNNVRDIGRNTFDLEANARRPPRGRPVSLDDAQAPDKVGRPCARFLFRQSLTVHHDRVRLGSVRKPATDAQAE
ncbi:hypothetical protein [uncultured Sphingobium sp.]|uniref:hypothetical protein n=1 Tax=uncultured Sphingobium sp. TaxID=316087 RepID=UPI00262B4758|nr:hypothetical protein [uncultured Sphingobium sp.]